MITIPVRTAEAHARIDKSVREYEMRHRSDKKQNEPGHAAQGGIVVMPIGPPVAITTTTTPTTSTTTTTTTTTVDPCSASFCTWTCEHAWDLTTPCPEGCECSEPLAICDDFNTGASEDVFCHSPSTSTTTNTTTTSCISSITGQTTTTTYVNKYVWPGKFIYRDIDNTTNDNWWIKSDDCWIQEINNKGLGLFCHYTGHLIDQYRGQVVIGVRNNSGGTTSCGTTTTTNTCICQGYCLWQINDGEPYWKLAENHCDIDQGCNCPAPDFCPADSGCGDTYTLCAKGVNPKVGLVNCTTTTSGTGTTSATTTTTTTTADPAGCGAGCVWKNIIGVMVLVSSDCSGDILPDGSICGPCLTPGVVDLCGAVVTPCTIIPPPPPPPSCTGECGWVWPDVEGYWWIQTANHCLGGFDGCFCDPPSVAGSVCNQRATTPCHPPSPTTTSGTGTTTSTSSTTATSTTTRGGCLDSCQWRWDVDDEEWVIIKDCGLSCGCSEPLFDGSGPCDIAKTPCRDTTTTTPTTSTTTTTTTTTCVDECTYECRQKSFDYVWERIADCGSPCECPEVPPTVICGPGYHKAGEQIVYRCQPTTSTTTTTTTTTPEPPICDCDCQHPLHTCIFCCTETIFGWFWNLCCNTCTSSCTLAGGSPSCDPAHENTTWPGVCSGSGSSTTFTTHTGTNTTASFTTAIERPTRTTTPTTTTTTTTTTSNTATTTTTTTTTTSTTTTTTTTTSDPLCGPGLNCHWECVGGTWKLGVGACADGCHCEEPSILGIACPEGTIVDNRCVHD